MPGQEAGGRSATRLARRVRWASGVDGRFASGGVGPAAVAYSATGTVIGGPMRILPAIISPVKVNSGPKMRVVDRRFLRVEVDGEGEAVGRRVEAGPAVGRLDHEAGVLARLPGADLRFGGAGVGGARKRAEQRGGQRAVVVAADLVDADGVGVHRHEELVRLDRPPGPCRRCPSRSARRCPRRCTGRRARRRRTTRASARRARRRRRASA